MQETLAGATDEVLYGLARAHGLDPAAFPEREGLIAALVVLPEPDRIVGEADRLRMIYLLDRLRPRQLRELGERYRIGLHGLKRKPDLVDALADAPNAATILMELEAQAQAVREAGPILGREGGGLTFTKVEELLEQARKRYQERRFEAALAAAQEASHLAERTTEQLRRASWSYAVLAAQALLEPCDPSDPETSQGLALLERAREAFYRGTLGDDAVMRDLVRMAEACHHREADRVRDLLAFTRDAIRETANLGGSVTLAEKAWKRGADYLDRDRLRAAREAFAEATGISEEGKRRRIQEVEESIEFVSNHIALARNVGADMTEADSLHLEAQTAIAAGQHGRAGDLLKRAERLAMKGQQRQIERAIQLRQSQVEKAEAILAACDPVLKEAESYDLSPAEVRTLLRQARDVLAKGDYLQGLTLARNAEEVARNLEAQIVEERRHRGITKPASGTCGVCRSRRVVFQDDGWGRCEDCGNTFRWRGPLAVWERLKSLLTP